MTAGARMPRERVTHLPWELLEREGSGSRYHPAMRALLGPLLLVAAVASPAHAGSGPTVTVAGTAGTGATDAYRATVVTKVKRSYLSGIKTCYRAALKQREGLEGTLSITFIIDKRGAATEIETTFEESIDACVLEAAKAWKFGVPKDSAKAAVAATFTIELELVPPPMTSEGRAYAVALTADNGGADTGEMSNRRPGADLSQQIADAKEGRNLKVGTGGGFGARATARDLLATGGPTVAKGPLGRITFSDSKAFDESTLTVGHVLRKVQSTYVAGLKRCYKTRLAVDATLKGKMKLDFSVNEAGRATGAKVRGFDPELDTCITGLMANWIFPVPKDRDGELTDASFGMTLTLVPD